MVSRDFATEQAQRLEVFEGFPRPDWNEAAFNEYVNVLIRCQSDQQCREVVTHFVETATKYPTIAVLLAQIRITNPPPTQTIGRCGKCFDGWRIGHFFSEGPGSDLQPISEEDAAVLLERIRKTRNCRSQVVTGAYRCSCLPVPLAPQEATPPKARKDRTFSDFTGGKR